MMVENIWVHGEDDTRLNIAFLLIILLTGALLALFLKDLTTDLYKQAALVFLTLLFLALPIWTVSQFALSRITGKRLTIGLGRNVIILAIALFLGFGAGLFLTAGKLSVTPASVSGGSTAFFGFFYKVIAAPAIEELFFRMTLFPFLLVMFGLILASGAFKPLRFLNGHERSTHLAAGFLAAVSVSLMFVLFHFFLPLPPYNCVLSPIQNISAPLCSSLPASVDKIPYISLEQRAFGNFLFSMVAISLNALTRSGAAGLGMHLMTNLIYFTGGGG